MSAHADSTRTVTAKATTLPPNRAQAQVSGSQLRSRHDQARLAPRAGHDRHEQRREPMNKGHAWDILTGYVSEETLRVVTAINGYTLGTLEDVLHAVTGFRSFDQLED